MAVFGWNEGIVSHRLQINFKQPPKIRMEKHPASAFFLNIHWLVRYSARCSLYIYYLSKGHINKINYTIYSTKHIYMLVFDPPTWTSMLVKWDHLPTKVTRNNTTKNTHEPPQKKTTTNPKTACWLANTGFTYLIQTSSREEVLAGILLLPLKKYSWVAIRPLYKSKNNEPRRSMYGLIYLQHCVVFEEFQVFQYASPIECLGATLSVWDRWKNSQTTTWDGAKAKTL